MDSLVVPQQQHQVEMEAVVAFSVSKLCYPSCPIICYEFCGDVYKVAGHIRLVAFEDGIEEILAYFNMYDDVFGISSSAT